MSKRFSINKEDAKKWLKNALIFLAPAALVFLGVLETGGTWEEGLIALKLWGINVLIDLIRKFAAGDK